MHDLVIIGGGITGQTAAIYAARKRMDFLLVAREMGGQFLESGEVLNYPGIVKTTGAAFSERMEKQLHFNGITPRDGETVQRIEKISNGFRVVSDRGVHEAHAVIVATGARARKLGVPGEERLARKGVTYCSICDGPLFSGMDIAIVGGGNSALEGANFTKDLARTITLVNLGPSFTAHEYLVENIAHYPNVETIHGARTIEIAGETSVSGLVYEKDGVRHTLPVRGVIVEIGRVPNTEFLEGFLDRNSQGHVVIDCWTRSSVTGVFAAGDCASGQEYQYVIAAGQGCMALLKASRYLAGLKNAF
ncbi:MAG: FAD-dependent oxidoreductase [Candidatus Aureabacteria bacterium]|nr:FAD-dependent oxidoreductase [Candidatus Auribacterota bacterium]NLW94616.1 FAD-dependent oxidoreductase [Chlamydiota bacterium]HOE27567.1 FAD-dependent oxidoreductase [bacterium]HQM52535.1 FAD-dependent oxidoreductase [bacterium]